MFKFDESKNIGQHYPLSFNFYRPRMPKDHDDDADDNIFFCFLVFSLLTKNPTPTKPPKGLLLFNELSSKRHTQFVNIVYRYNNCTDFFPLLPSLLQYLLEVRNFLIIFTFLGCHGLVGPLLTIRPPIINSFLYMQLNLHRCFRFSSQHDNGTSKGISTKIQKRFVDKTFQAGAQTNTYIKECSVLYIFVLTYGDTFALTAQCFLAIQILFKHQTKHVTGNMFWRLARALPYL